MYATEPTEARRDAPNPEPGHRGSAQSGADGFDAQRATLTPDANTYEAQLANLSPDRKHVTLAGGSSGPLGVGAPKPEPAFGAAQGPEETREVRGGKIHITSEQTKGLTYQYKTSTVDAKREGDTVTVVEDHISLERGRGRAAAGGGSKETVYKEDADATAKGLLGNLKSEQEVLTGHLEQADEALETHAMRGARLKEDEAAIERLPSEAAKREARKRIAQKREELDGAARRLHAAKSALERKKAKVDAALGKLEPMVAGGQPVDVSTLVEIAEGTGSAADTDVALAKVSEKTRTDKLAADATVLKKFEATGEIGSMTRVTDGNGVVDSAASSGAIVKAGGSIDNGKVAGTLSVEHGSGVTKTRQVSYDAKSSTWGLQNSVSSEGKSTVDSGLTYNQDTGDWSGNLGAKGAELAKGKTGQQDSGSLSLGSDHAGIDVARKGQDVRQGKHGTVTTSYSIGGGATLKLNAEYDATRAQKGQPPYKVSLVLSGSLNIGGGVKAEGKKGTGVSGGVTASVKLAGAVTKTRFATQEGVQEMLGRYEGVEADEGMELSSLDEWKVALGFTGVPLRAEGDSDVESKSMDEELGVTGEVAAGIGKLGAGVTVKGGTAWTFSKAIVGGKVRYTIKWVESGSVKAQLTAGAFELEGGARVEQVFKDAESVSFDVGIGEQESQGSAIERAIRQASSINDVMALAQRYTASAWERSSSTSEERGGTAGALGVSLDIANKDSVDTKIAMKNAEVSFEGKGTASDAVQVKAHDTVVASDSVDRSIETVSRGEVGELDVSTTRTTTDVGAQPIEGGKELLGKVDKGLVGTLTNLFTTASSNTVVQHVGPAGIDRLVGRVEQAYWASVPGHAGQPRCQEAWLALGRHLKNPSAFAKSIGQNDLVRRINTLTPADLAAMGTTKTVADLRREMALAMRMQALARFGGRGGATECLEHALNRWNEAAGGRGPSDRLGTSEGWGGLTAERARFKTARSRVYAIEGTLDKYLDKPNGKVLARKLRADLLGELGFVKQRVSTHEPLNAMPTVRTDMINQLLRLEQSVRRAVSTFITRFVSKKESEVLASSHDASPDVVQGLLEGDFDAWDVGPTQGPTLQAGARWDALEADRVEAQKVAEHTAKREEETLRERLVNTIEVMKRQRGKEQGLFLTVHEELSGMFPNKHKAREALLSLTKKEGPYDTWRVHAREARRIQQQLGGAREPIPRPDTAKAALLWNQVFGNGRGPAVMQTWEDM